MDVFDRFVGRWSGIVGLVSGSGIVISYAGGAISQIRHFSWYFEWPLIFFTGVFVIMMSLRLVVLAHHRGDLHSAQHVVHGHQFAHFGGDVADSAISGNVMIVGEPRSPVEAVPRLPSTPELLAALAAELDQQATAIARFLPEPLSYRLAPDWYAQERERDEHQQLEDRERNRYIVEQHARSLHLYEEARSRGYPWDDLETWSTHAPNNRHSMETWVIGLRAIAERMRFDLEHAGVA
jgi:hypothetical protein